MILPHSTRPCTRRRSAYILISVLVCLTVVMVLATAWLRSLALERRHIRADARGIQAELLAASALSRAKARLAADPDYAGEIWTIDADSLDGRFGGKVTIQVEQAGEPQSRSITVAAEYPAEEAQRARRSRQATITLSQALRGEDESS